MRVSFVMVLSCLLLATHLGFGQKIDESSGIPNSKEAQLPRIIAEWESAVGVLISWPLYLPDALLVELAADSQLVVLVRSDQISAARQKMVALSIPSEHLRFVECSVDSPWPRDWGPHQRINQQGMWQILDPKFGGYPIFPRAGGKIQFTYKTGSGDDAVNLAIARDLGTTAVDFPAFLTGGNFLVDGFQTAFCTQAQIDENKNFSVEEFEALVLKHTGIKRLIVLENIEEAGIQHIDCWLKVLDPGRLLIKRAPPNHPDTPALERNVKKLAATKSVFGQPFEIIRIDCPTIPRPGEPGSSPPIAAYTNSLILNHKILVPLYDIEGDEAALATWRNAMPGYQVHGFVFNDWKDYDALHCRTRALFDRELLRLEHAPLPHKTAISDEGYVVNVIVSDTTPRHPVLQSRLKYRIAGADTTWNTIALAPGNKPHHWSAVIPAQREGTTIEYFVESQQSSGKTITHPRCGLPAVHRFTVVDESKKSLVGDGDPTSSPN